MKNVRANTHFRLDKKSTLSSKQNVSLHDDLVPEDFNEDLPRYFSPFWTILIAFWSVDHDRERSSMLLGYLYICHEMESCQCLAQFFLPTPTDPDAITTKTKRSNRSAAAECSSAALDNMAIGFKERMLEMNRLSSQKHDRSVEEKRLSRLVKNQCPESKYRSNNAASYVSFRHESFSSWFWNKK